MSTKTETRSSIDGITEDIDPGQGVGGRHENRHPPTEGGGYLDNYTVLNDPYLKKIAPPHDPRLDLLAKAELADHWLQIADLIGFDNFMTVWIILDSENIHSTPKERRRRKVYVPQYRRFQRLMRDQFIIDLANRGKKPHVIHSLLIKNMCERVSIRHIERTIQASKIDK